MSCSTAEQERARISALYDCDVLDTPPEPEFDDLSALAARICDTPVAGISLVDEGRAWIKSCVGLSLTEVPSEGSLCLEAIRRGDDILIVADTMADRAGPRTP